MKPSRYVLSAVAVAVCQLSVAQEAVPAAAPLVTSSGAPVVPATAAPQAVESVDARQAKDAAEPPRKPSEPRYIRGDDRVVAPAKPVARLEGAPLSFSFEEAPVAEVVRTILGDIIKADYVLHPPLSGTVTLTTRTPIPPDQAVFLLESALQANGLALLRDARGTYHVGRPDVLKGIGGAIRQVGNGPLPAGYGAIVVPLQYIGAGEMATILRPMAPGDAIVRVDNVRNLLVLAGTRTQAEGWLDIINTFDVNLLKGMSVGVFPLKYASIQEVETALRLVSGGGAAAAPAAAVGGAVVAATPGAAGAAQGAGAATQAMLGEGNPLFGALRIMPIERLNSILVVTPRAAYLEEARRWIEKLDQPSDNGAEPQLFIYKVQNGNARHLAGVLSGIFGGTTAGAGNTANSGVAPGLNSGTANSFGQMGGNSGFGSGFGSGYGSGFGNSGSAFGNTGFGSSGYGRSGLGGSNTFGSGLNSQNRNQGTNTAPGTPTAQLGSVRVMADELNNSILVWGTRGEFAKIEAVMKRMDLPPTQVLIEASIIEVTLNDELSYGVQWAFNGGARSGYRGLGQLTDGENTLTGNLLAPKLGGFTYSLANSAGNIRVILNALAKKTMVKMVSNPSLMVLDNHVAMMSVGDQVPVQSSTTNNDVSNTTTTTVQYRDTGVNLAVTPSVNAGNLVTMQIDQTVTDSRAASSGSNAQPTFMQRQISSKVAVRSGETIVLGGLIKDTKDNGKTGIPLLQDIPLVGNLFGSNSRNGDRTELLVVITPRVVRTDPEIREVSEELRDRLKGLQVIEMRERGAVPAASGISAPVQPLPGQ